MSYHGMTDGPPSTLSGTEIAHEYLEATGGREAELRLSDGSHLIKLADLDLDYLWSFLAEIRTGDSTDFLAVFVRHGRHPERGWNLDAEWRNDPRETFDDHTEHQIESLRWWISWSYGRVEEYDKRP